MNIYLIASAIIAALAIVVIAIVAIVAAKNVKETMASVQTTVTRVETKVNTVADKANGLLDRTNGIADDAEKKLQAFDEFTKTANNLERSTQHLDESFQKDAFEVSNPSEKQQKVMNQASVVTETIARIVYGFKKNKPKGHTIHTKK